MCFRRGRQISSLTLTEFLLHQRVDLSPSHTQSLTQVLVSALYWTLWSIIHRVVRCEACHALVLLLSPVTYSLHLAIHSASFALRSSEGAFIAAGNSRSVSTANILNRETKEPSVRLLKFRNETSSLLGYSLAPFRNGF